MESPLEQAFQSHGDELYQTALLLSLEPQQAEGLLLRAMRTLAADPPAAPGLVTLTAALLAAMPTKPRQIGKLSWLPGGADGAIIAQIAKLSADQRLALDLMLRRDYEPQQVAPLFGHDAGRAENELYTALLTLAPAVEPDLPAGLLEGNDAGEDCRQTRRVLATTPGAVFDRTVRAHLATCAGCRSAEQAWGRIRTAVEHALRAALRHVELPATASERIRDVLAPKPAAPFAGRKISPRTLQIGLPVIVLLLVALLVLPRSGQPQSGTGAVSVGTSEPRALVQQAIDTLYSPEPNEPTWHSQYEMRWNFSDRMYVNLVGDIWTANGTERFRAQLVHSEGGAPYEFLLDGGGQYMWYANTLLYGKSIYGTLANQFSQQVRIEVPKEQRTQVQRARLDSGAWGLPGRYLSQALAADRLSTWGRQRGADGRDQMVIGFNGYSPLGFAPDVPDLPQLPTTILLTVDVASGRLREIREVTGPAGGEQVGRMIWRQITGAPIESEALATVFSLERAYNGMGDFRPVGDANGIADPYLPIVPASAIRPPTDAIAQWEGGTQLPATAPPGTDRALAIAPNPWEPLTVVYLGPGRMATFGQSEGGGVNLSMFADLSDRDRIERSEQNESTLWLAPGTGMRYGLQMARPFGRGSTENNIVRVETFGFTRAEVLQIADVTSPFYIDKYTANAQLFRPEHPHDPQAFQALLEAVQPQPLAPNEASMITADIFTRQGPLEDPLPDPYHEPYYPNGSEAITLEQWVRRLVNRIEFSTTQRNTAGEIVNQTLDSVDRSFYYDRASNYSNTYLNETPPTREPITEPIWSAINLLGCGGTTMETGADGIRIITQIDQNWYEASCNRPHYAYLVYSQVGGANQSALRPPQTDAPFYGDTAPDSGPYLADLLGPADRVMYHRLFINREGRAFRYEVRVGRPDGTLVEATEIKQERRMPSAQAPASAFSSSPPSALFHDDQTLPSDGTGLWRTSELTFTQVITQLNIPLWYLPPGEGVELRRVAAADTRSITRYWTSDVFDTALRTGIAAQIVYAPPPGDISSLSQTMYVGLAEPFRALLRTQRVWRSSAQMQVVVAGQPTEAWQIITRENNVWCLFERDGALIAIDISTPARLERIAQLQRFEP